MDLLQSARLFFGGILAPGPLVSFMGDKTPFYGFKPNELVMSFIHGLCGVACMAGLARAQEKPRPAPQKQSVLKRAAETENVKEALLRYLFVNQKVDTQSKVYFLSIEGKDTKGDLLQRFQNNSIPVKNLSQVRYGADGVPFDKATHQRGCVFDLSGFRWATDNKAWIKAHVHWGGKAGYGGTYPILRQKTQWVVKQPTAPYEN